VTTSRETIARLLTDAAQQVSTLLTSPAPPADAHPQLAPCLGSLNAATHVLADFSKQLGGFFTAGNHRTPAGLFALAALTSATSRLAEATGEFITAVESICARTGAPAEESIDDLFRDFTVPFTGPEDRTVRTAAQASGMAAREFIALAAIVVAASLNFGAACREIQEELLTDAEYFRANSDTVIATDLSDLMRQFLDAPAGTV
jgi:hypothetical protein